MAVGASRRRRSCRAPQPDGRRRRSGAASTAGCSTACSAGTEKELAGEAEPLAAEVTRTPFANFADHRDKAAPHGRQAILYLRRHHAVVLSRDQPALRQRLEFAAENARRDLR